MRVLHIGKYYPPVPGGMEYFLRDLLVALSKKGVQAYALVHHHKTGIPSSLENLEGVRILRAEILGHFGFAPLSVKFPKFLLEWIRYEKPDLLHLHLPNPSALWALILPLAKDIPWVIHWHSDVIPSPRTLKILYPPYSILEKCLLRYASLIIATSPDYLHSSPVLKNFPSKCVIVPLGIDTKRIIDSTSLRTNWAERMWKSGSFRLLSVGRLTYYKGFDLLIKAMTKLPKDIMLHIVGSGNLEGYLKALTKEMGVDDRVIFDGYLPDEYLSALFHSCDCFVIGSIDRTEAFGIVLMEAMWHGKPIIASNIEGSGLRWIMREARCGLLFEPGDIRDCAEKILWIKNHPEKALEFGKSGRHHLEKNLLISHVAEKIIGLYEALK